jgi:hypothetical protein
MNDVRHMPPMRRPREFRALMFACCAAPIFWLGQLALGYWVSAQACFGGDRPNLIAPTGTLRMALLAFDAVAIAAATAGLLVALACRRSAGEGRPRFMALWGIFSSLCFLAAILFATIASIMVPPCPR